MKQLFPFFANNPTTVYLDSAATTQKPLCVIEAMKKYYVMDNANAHRGNYTLGNNVTAKYEATRQKVADFIGANSASDIVWTKGTTDAINLVAGAWGRHNIKKDDTILVLGSEHHANFVPWQQLAKQNNANFKVVNVQADGSPDISHYKQLLALRPKLVAIQHCSNALGNIHPISELVDLAKAVGATTLVDGAQAIAHLPIDLAEINCDMYVFSAHKMYGPMGLGVLYIQQDVKQHFKPYQYGGEMIEQVSIEDTKFRAIPALLETGTQNIAAIWGLDAAIDFMQQDNYQQALQQKHALYQYLLDALKDVGSITIYGDTQHNIGVVSFRVEDESISDISAILSEQDIAIRTGHHCAMPLMQALAIDGTHRVSLGVYNDQKDTDNFITALTKAIDLLN